MSIKCPVCEKPIRPYRKLNDNYEDMNTVLARCHGKRMQLFVYPENGSVMGYYEDEDTPVTEDFIVSVVAA